MRKRPLLKFLQVHFAAAPSPGTVALGARDFRATLWHRAPRWIRPSLRNRNNSCSPLFKVTPAAALLLEVDGGAGEEVGPCVCGLGSSCCCLALCRCSLQPKCGTLQNFLTSCGPCSSASLDQVHVADGMHEANMLHGSNVTVVTRRGDKIKGQLLGRALFH
jgi:hypothetical protein